ncbi:hypothetical protein pb186bvf_014659 [Paramecium bursaria]
MLFLILIQLIQCKYKFPSDYYSHRRDLQTSGQQVVNSTNLQIPWNNIRIEYDFISTFDPQSMNYVAGLLNITKTFLSKHILVRSNYGQLKYNSNWGTTLGGFEIPQTLRAKSYNADIVFFIKIENSPDESYLAYAGPQKSDSSFSDRPTFCVASFNMAHVNLLKMTDILYQTAISTSIHEFLHGFGFIYDMASSFYDSVTGITYQNVTFVVDNINYLSMPRMVNFAQNFFQCSSIKGIRMEDQGGQGTALSHFDRVLFGKEMMTGSDITGQGVMTDLTFQFLQDTGYYRIAEYSPDINSWGYQKGCDFVNKLCNSTKKYPEFCYQNNTIGCSYDGSGVAVCLDSDQLSNGCEYMTGDESYLCLDPTITLPQNQLMHTGYDSMCIEGFISNVSGTTNSIGYGCYQYKCTNGQLNIIVNNLTFPCPEGGNITTPAGYFGQIYCPQNPSLYCIIEDDCPNQCNSRGFCMRGMCTCNIGYSGASCQNTCTTLRRNDQCVTTCPSGTYPETQSQYCIGCPGNCQTCSNFNKCTVCKDGYVLKGDFCDNQPYSLSSIIYLSIILIL